MPTRELAYRAALHTSDHLWFSKYSFHILPLDCQIDFWSIAFALAASPEFRLLVSLPTACLQSLMSGVQHLFELAQIQVFFAVVLRTLLIASLHHAASYSTSSAANSALG
jgi:hypothetical protein